MVIPSTFGDAISRNSEGISNKFFDAMGGGFDYPLVLDIIEAKRDIPTLDFQQEFSNNWAVVNPTMLASSDDLFASYEKLEALGEKVQLIPSQRTRKRLPLKGSSDELAPLTSESSNFLSSSDGGAGLRS